MKKSRTLPDRFWSKVAFSQAGCWEWKDCKTIHGYGRFWLNGKTAAAHRVAYQIEFGEIPPGTSGMEIDHKCRNRNCVRPSHLELVTRRENVLRGYGVTAHCAHKTHCPKGHPYDVIRMSSDGRFRQRDCRECKQENCIRYRNKIKTRSIAKPESFQ